MGCLHFEGAVIGPQVDRIGDVAASSLVDLGRLVKFCRKTCVWALTISADSGPAMLNSISAYFFQ